MCGRFSLTTPEEVIAKFFSLLAIPRLKPRYNLAPTQACSVIRQDDTSGGRRLDPMHWGLIPSWAKDKSIGNRMINARGETLAEKPSFREAYRKRRCLIPADGFYEWKKEGKRKQPHWIGRANRALFAFAGLWEKWNESDQDVIESFTIITTEPNETIRTLHDRMPVILDPSDYDAWLDPDQDDANTLQELLVATPIDLLEFHPISTRVNSPTHDDPSILEPLDSSGLFD
ncbi:MAG: SOS response-associated peptidase [Planctomycetota bacterium]|nr:SOS response-associated peptidase [Planctomycetota bacterium]